MNSVCASVSSRSRRVEGLRIEAWDAADVCPYLIDVAVTDAQGTFEMHLADNYAANLLRSRKPVLVFRVFENAKPVTQAHEVVWNVVSQTTRLELPLAEEDDPSIARQKPSPSLVRGTVCQGDGSSAMDVVVSALDRNLTPTGFSDAPLGQTRTDALGRYEIRYVMAAGGKVKADLIVRVGMPATTPSSPLVAGRDPSPLEGGRDRPVVVGPGPGAGGRDPAVDATSRVAVAVEPSDRGPRRRGS